jgi:hypothetical protein
MPQNQQYGRPFAADGGARTELAANHLDGSDAVCDCVQMHEASAPADSTYYAILSDPELLAAREGHVARLRSVFDGTYDSYTAFALRGHAAWIRGAGATDAEAEIARALQALAPAAEALRDPHVFRPLALECEIYGVHFTDKILGADVFDLQGSWQVHPVSHAVGELPIPNLDSDPTWRRAQELARAFVAAGASVPYFGLPTIASTLNVGVNLYGQELLAAMLECPAAAHRDLRVINDLLCTMHRWYLETLPLEQLQPVIACERTQPPGFGQLCGCTTQLISPRQYGEFVAPLDAALLGTYPHGGMIHLCGSHTQHIPTWREMKQLRALQIMDRAADDLELYWNGLRLDQVIYVHPSASMPIPRIIEITRGNRVVIVADVPDPPAMIRRAYQ